MGVQGTVEFGVIHFCCSLERLRLRYKVSIYFLSAWCGGTAMRPVQREGTVVSFFFLCVFFLGPILFL